MLLKFLIWEVEFVKVVVIFLHFVLFVEDFLLHFFLEVLLLEFKNFELFRYHFVSLGEASD